MTKFSKAFGILIEALEKDESYRRGWQANIAMAFQDEYGRRINKGKRPSKKDVYDISNKAAVYFLSLLCTSGKAKKFKMLKDLYEEVEK